MFRWTSDGGGQQWIDLSLFDNGFAPGTFIGVGPLAPDASRFQWVGLLPRRTHYARVNVLTSNGWRPSATITFATPACNEPASSLTIASQSCSPTLAGRVSITATWRPSTDGAQWVDLSLGNGFQPWTFLSTGPLAPETGSVAWTGLLEDSVHYLRVNTLTPAGWKPSAVVQFRTLRCGSPTPTRPVVTLTFDDGGPYADEILDILAEKGARAIFFPYGTWALAHPDLLARMKSSGHLVGNHTYSHVNLTLLSSDRVRAEIEGGDVGNSDLFRPVYGIMSTAVQAIVEEMGFRVYMWHIDPMDWKKTYPGGDKDIVQEVVSQAFSGAVVILHMQSENTVRALPVIIDQLRAAGYELTW
jgi:peptidoglycan/xylan/chitin deacetylase (PgdA/CDA1 family)